MLQQVARADFSYLRDRLELTDGNLSRNLAVLEESGYVTIDKAFEGKRPRTWVKITKAGTRALAEEMDALRLLLHELDGSKEAAMSFPWLDSSNLTRMAVTATSALQEQDLLAAARRGDEDAFRRIVEEHRLPLQAHCYRMLGSLQDAEDALQETFLRAWRGLSEFGGRSSLRTWLYRIATNVCIDASSRRSKRMLPTDAGPASRSNDVNPPLVETTWVEPYPDEMLGIPDGYAAPGARYEQREAVELAFVASLQHLPATQRAVLILRDVLGFSAKEVAERLDTSVASVNSALAACSQGCRRAASRAEPAGDVARARRRTRSASSSRRTSTPGRDATSKQSPRSLPRTPSSRCRPGPSGGRAATTIASFAKNEDCPETRTFPIPIRVNGQLGIAAYSLDEETGRYVPAAIDVLTFEGGLIKEITAFVTPELFPHFGLPPELEP